MICEYIAEYIVNTIHTLAKWHSLDVNGTIATSVTLIASSATSRLESAHYLPNAVIDTLYKLSLLLMRNLQGRNY